MLSINLYREKSHSSPWYCNVHCREIIDYVDRSLRDCGSESVACISTNGWQGLFLEVGQAQVNGHYHGGLFSAMIMNGWGRDELTPQVRGCRPWIGSHEGVLWQVIVSRWDWVEWSTFVLPWFQNSRYPQIAAWADADLLRSGCRETTQCWTTYCGKCIQMRTHQCWKRRTLWGFDWSTLSLKDSVNVLSTKMRSTLWLCVPIASSVMYRFLLNSSWNPLIACMDVRVPTVWSFVDNLCSKLQKVKFLCNVTALGKSFANVRKM